MTRSASLPGWTLHTNADPGTENGFLVCCGCTFLHKKKLNSGLDHPPYAGRHGWHIDCTRKGHCQRPGQTLAVDESGSDLDASILHRGYDLLYRNSCVRPARHQYSKDDLCWDAGGIGCQPVQESERGRIYITTCRSPLSIFDQGSL